MSVSKYYGGTITVQGRNLITSLLAGETIEFTRILVGKGQMPEGVEPIDMTALVDPCAEGTSSMSYSMDDVRVKFNQFCKAIRDEHEAELAYLREKSGLSTKRNGKVGRPRKTERHS